jgi:uncharacterized membrane protein
MFSEALLVFFAAAAPISELRGAIPLAVGFGFSAPAAYVLAVIGNMAPIVPLLFFLRYAAQWVMDHSPRVRRLLEWVFHRTRTKHGHKFENFGFVALALFVAIPLPLTGAWTGAVIAYLIDMPIKKAFFAILTGVVIAGALVLGATLGLIHIIRV